MRVRPGGVDARAQSGDNHDVVPDRPRFEIVKDDLQSFIGTSGPLMMAVTRRPPTTESLDSFRDALRKHSAAYPDQMLLLVALRSKRPRLSNSGRTKIIDMWGEFGGRIAVGVWVGGRSFAKSLQRSFITALSLIRVRETPFRVVSEGSDALEWFSELQPRYRDLVPGWKEAVTALVEREDARDEP